MFALRKIHSKLTFLSLVVLLSTIHHSSCSNPTIDFLFGQIYEPYQNQFETFQHTLKLGLRDSLTTFIDPHLIKEAYDEEPEAPIQYLQPQKLDKEIAEEVDSNSRMLQLSLSQCNNGGISVIVPVKYYFCSEKSVTKEYYEENSATQNCTIETTPRDLCYCPFEYYGFICENFNRISCSISGVSHPTTCQRNDSKYFVYSYGQPEMPCTFAAKNSSIEMNFKLDCKHQNQTWAYEGIKTELEKLDFDPVQIENAFKYKIDTPELKSTELSQFMLKMKFVNWKRLFKSYALETSVSGDQMVGENNVTISVSIDSNLAAIELAGRYFYEIIVDDNKINMNKYAGSIEDADYSEPSRKRLTTAEKYFYYILFTFVICAVTCWLLLSKKILVIRKPERRNSYEPLIEMHDMSSDARHRQ